MRQIAAGIRTVVPCRQRLHIAYQPCRAKMQLCSGAPRIADLDDRTLQTPGLTGGSPFCGHRLATAPTFATGYSGVGSLPASLIRGRKQ